MKYFFLKKINQKTLKSFYEFVNEYSGPTTIYMDTNGGCTLVTRAILDIINRSPLTFTLMAANVFSSGFDLFYRAKCDKILLGGAKGMYHQGYQSANINDKGDIIEPEDICSYEIGKQFHYPESMKMCTEFMTAEELKLFESGGDVFFTFNRLREIFPNVKVV